MFINDKDSMEAALHAVGVWEREDFCFDPDAVGTEDSSWATLYDATEDFVSIVLSAARWHAVRNIRRDEIAKAVRG